MLRMKHLTKYEIVFVSIIITFLIFIAYYNSLSLYFFADDFDYLFFAQESKLSVEGIFRILFSITSIQFIRPVAKFLWSIDYSIWGVNPFGYHLTNIIIHCLNSILIIFLVQLFTNNKMTSILTGMLFSIYPLHLESVNWISGRFELSCLFFYLLSLIFFIIYIRSNKILFLGFSIISSMLSILSKEPGITIIVLIIFADIFLNKKKSLKQRLKIYLPYIITSILYLLYRVLRFGQIANYSEYVRDPTQLNITISNIINNIVIRLSEVLLLPLNQSIINNYSFIKSVAIITTISIFILVVLKKRFFWRDTLIGIFWIFVNLTPVILFFYVSKELEGSRVLYMPSVGFCLIMGSLIAGTGGGKIFWKIFQGIVVLVILTFSVIAVRLNNTTWVEASAMAKVIPRQISSISTIIKENSNLYFFNIPSTFKGVPFYGTGYNLARSISTFLNKPVKAFLIDYSSSTKEDPIDLSKLKIGYSDFFFFWNDETKNLIDLTFYVGNSTRIQKHLLTKLKSKFPELIYSEKDQIDPFILMNEIVKLDKKVDGITTYEATGNDPYLHLPKFRINSLLTESVEIRMKVQKRPKLPSTGLSEIYWITENEQIWDRLKRIPFKTKIDSRFHTYIINVRNDPRWIIGGTVREFRLDPINYPVPFQIEYLKFIPFNLAGTEEEP